ncbi:MULTISPECIES: hypothetical protein [unclassified Halomonas]|uniref:hypothetical protein n=1 Tax=unclassified Halomonas TaxID=2609666 RepID=UPI0007F16256|nr:MULTISPECIES: hypothetical protein [unclassified Halomonas]SBR47403.1 hypothetical protein GA0071314_1187 [Halomonas sp. HL-93]SNY99198.1 hypothetical protein SAMN04488142_3837 [Halomonas sp. hl-4]
MNEKLKFIFEAFAAYFILLQIFSVIYLYFFWKVLGVDFFDYVAIQDVIFSSGEFSLYFTAFVILGVAFFYKFELFQGRSLLSLKWYLIFLIFTMSLSVVASLHLPYEYKWLWRYILLSNAVAVHYFSSSLASKGEIANFFTNRLYAYVSIFVIISGVSFSISVPVWEGLRIHDSNLGKVRYVKVKDCDECYHWLLGRLGEFSFVTVRDKSKVVAIPNGNIENITHHSYR